MKNKLIFVLVTILLAGLVLAADSPYARRIRPFASTPVSCIENEIGYNMTTHQLLICNNTLTYQIVGGGGGAGSFTTLNTSGASVLASPVTIGVGQTTTGTTDLLINPAVKASGNLIDLQVGGVNKFNVDSAGFVFIRNTATPTILSVGNVGNQFFSVGSNATVSLANNGILSFGASNAKIQSPVDGIIQFSNQAVTDFSRLQLGGTTSSFPAIKRNGAAIDFRLADDSAYATINAIGADFQAGDIFIRSGFIRSSTDQTAFSTNGVHLKNTGLIQWTSSGSGLGTTDATLSRNAAGILQIGTTTANALGSLLAATGTFSGTVVGNAFSHGSFGRIVFNSDGVFQLRNDAGTDFGRLQFGGTTSAFPSLKRNGAILEAKLADDGGYAAFWASTLTLNSGAPILRINHPSSGTAGFLIDTAGGVGGHIFTGLGGIFGWSGTGTAGTNDTTISRNAAGVLQVGTTTANALGSLLASSITLTNRIDIGTNNSYGWGASKARITSPSDGAVVITNAAQTPGTGDLTVATINGVKKYVALLTQSVSSDPTAIVLENTLGGTVVWARTSAGVYTATLTGAFTAAKTVCFTQMTDQVGGIPVTCKHTSTNVITIGTLSTDDILTDSGIEIRVYP